MPQIDGVSASDVGQCGECGSESFTGIEVARTVVSFKNRDGLLESMRDDECIKSAFTTVDCAKCGHSIVEDGELVD